MKPTSVEVVLGIFLPALMPLFLPNLARMLRRQGVANDLARFRRLLAAAKQLTGLIGDGEQLPAEARTHALALRSKVNWQILAEARVYPDRRLFRLIAAFITAFGSGLVMLAPMHGAAVFEGLLSRPLPQIVLLVVTAGVATWTTERLASTRRAVALQRVSPLVVRVVLFAVLLPLVAFVVYRIVYFIDFRTHLW